MADRKPEHYNIIGSDGQVERYADPYANYEPEDAADAERKQAVIIQEKTSIEVSFLKLAFLLDDFERDKHFKALGFTSMNQWLNSPEVDIGARVGHDLLRIAREAVPLLADASGEADETDQIATAIEQLGTARVSKVRSLLPLLNADKEEDFVELVQKSPDLTWTDVNKEVKARIKGREDLEDDVRPYVFQAYVRRGETVNTYRVVMTNGVDREDCGTIRVPARGAARFEERFGYWLRNEE